MLIWTDNVEKTIPYQQFQRHLTAYKRAFVRMYSLPASPEEIAEGYSDCHQIFGSAPSTLRIILGEYVTPD
jgi:hypothetical protein